MSANQTASRFRLCSAAFIGIVVTSGLAACTTQADYQAKMDVEVKQMRAEDAQRGKLDDGIPKAGVDLATISTPATAMGRANWAEIQKARLGMLPSLVSENVFIAMAEKSVAAQMRDPESVHFQDVVLKYYSGKPYVCGLFNAKNGFGAYVGYERFLFASPTTIILNKDKNSKYYEDLVLTNSWQADDQISRDAAIQYFCES